jgi:hypothetical protein
MTLTPFPDPSEQFSMPVPESQMSQIDPAFFGSAPYAMPIPGPYTYGTQIPGGVPGDLWALDSLSQVGLPLPSAGSNSEWLEDMIQNSVPTSTTEQSIGYMPEPAPLVETDPSFAEDGQDFDGESSRILPDEIGDMLEVDPTDEESSLQPVDANSAIPDSPGDSGNPNSSLKVIPGNLDEVSTPVAEATAVNVAMVEIEVYEIEDGGLSPKEGPSIVEEPQSREDPYPDYLSVRTATEEPIDAPGVMAASKPHMDPIDEGEAEYEQPEDADEVHLSGDVRDVVSADNMDGSQPAVLDDDALEGVPAADQPVPHEEEDGSPTQDISSPVLENQSDAEVSMTQPDTYDPAASQTLVVEDASKVARYSVDGMMVDSESEAADQKEEDPFAHMGTGKGGPGEVLEEEEERVNFGLRWWLESLWRS